MNQRKSPSHLDTILLLKENLDIAIHILQDISIEKLLVQMILPQKIKQYTQLISKT